MPNVTSIQWCDTTVNPIMGCGGCELFPSPGEVLDAIDQAVTDTGSPINSRAIYKELVNKAHAAIPTPLKGHLNTVNTTNIWQLKELFLERLMQNQGKPAADAAYKAIRQSITCYAATLHLNRGQKLTAPNYGGQIGHAPIFEKITRFEGRAAEVAREQDLLGRSNPKTPWKDLLPRMIFVSDMGDALTAKADFPFLKSDLMPAVTSDAGKRHLWLWLTKRPRRMAEFADDIGGFPPNVCAMTTLTGADAESLQRLADLKKVKASIRGLSIEPLWERIPPSKLNLKGIDWVIVGGESGSGRELTRPFQLEWAMELRDHCRAHGVAFFLKQLGRNPTLDGQPVSLKDRHGGEWEEWTDATLKVREFPKAFHAYRRGELKASSQLRPVVKNKAAKHGDAVVTREQKTEFDQLDRIVRKGIEAFAQAGEALAKIHEGDLWKAGGHKSWDDYCRSVAGISRVHAFRLMKASQCLSELKTLPIGNVLPVSESQLRPLLKLESTEQRAAAWTKAVELAEDRQPTALDVKEAVIEILPPDDVAEKPETRSQMRRQVVDKLRTAIRRGAGPERLERLLEELEALV